MAMRTKFPKKAAKKKAPAKAAPKRKAKADSNGHGKPKIEEPKFTLEDDEPESLVYEICLRGYDGGTGATDHLVKRIDAPSEEAVKKFVAASGLVLECGPDETAFDGGDVKFADGLDLVIDADGKIIDQRSDFDLAKWLAEQDQPAPAATIAAEPIDEHALLGEIRDAEIECAEAEAEMEQRKAALKNAKEFYEGCVSRLRRLCRDQGKEYPLFDAKPKAEAAATEPAEDDSWKSVQLETLGLADGILKKLHEAGIDTLGTLADFSAADKRLTDINGIGPAAVEDIEAATTEFWAKRKAGSEETAAVETVTEQSSAPATNEELLAAGL